MEHGISPIAPLTLRLTLYSLTGSRVWPLGHMMSSVMWQLEPQLVVSYWSSVDTMSLSCTIAKILSVKNNWVTSLTPRCHMTSLVTWPLEPQMVLSYWWSVDAKSLMPLPFMISCSSKSRLVFPFWNWLTWIVRDKEPITGVVLFTYTVLASINSVIVSQLW